LWVPGPSAFPCSASWNDRGVMFVLVHSPLVGPTTWRSVGTHLRAGGESVAVPAISPDVFASKPILPTIERAVADSVDACFPAGSVVLVGHSGAGPLLPGIADLMTSHVRALMYVDALLPMPGVSWFQRAPDELAARLRGLARAGVLPTWDEWFEPGAVDELLPDSNLRAQFQAELPRLPLRYFDEPEPPASWRGPNGYLLLSEAYLAEAARARTRGWPVLERPGHHLSMVTEPAAVGDAIVELARRLGRS